MCISHCNKKKSIAEFSITVSDLYIFCVGYPYHVIHHASLNKPKSPRAMTPNREQHFPETLRKDPAASAAGALPIPFCGNRLDFSHFRHLTMCYRCQAVIWRFVPNLTSTVVFGLALASSFAGFFFLLWLQCIEIKILIVFTQRSSTNNFTFIYLPLLAGSLFSRSGFAGRDKLKFEKRDIPGMDRWMMVDLARTGWNFSSKICLVICKSVSRVKCLQLDCLFRGNDRRRFDDRANFLPCM